MVAKPDKDERLPHVERIELGLEINANDHTAILARAYHDDREGFNPVIVDLTAPVNWDDHVTGEKTIPGATIQPDDPADIKDAVKYTEIEKPTDKFVTQYGLPRSPVRVALLYEAFDASAAEVVQALPNGPVVEANVEIISDWVAHEILQNDEEHLEGTDDLQSTVTVATEEAR
ncbi:hypothetical protein [Natrinema salinisoli]|uniref:hypothetical protein n=1 Tax=Natrinema salinisoli TaxID=2878535 RepID=UPI001CF03A64|nr:hypothetical protein [Natrinema salinisoli]